MKGRGFSLLEVCVAMVVLLVAVFVLQFLYVRLLAANLTADRNQEVVAAFDTLVEIVRQRVRSTWPPGPPPDPSLVWTGVFSDYAYRVEDSGRVLDPLDSSGTSYLNLKRIHLSMSYPDARNRQTRSLRVTFSVAR